MKLLYDSKLNIKTNTVSNNKILKTALCGQMKRWKNV